MITITAWLSEPHESGYKYIITRGASSWTAYRTDKGFKAFMARTGLEIDRSEVTEGGYISRYDKKKAQVVHTWKPELRIEVMCCKPREIREEYFWKLNELPPGVISYTGLCNGSYVTCYYLKEADKTTIYRPNPNAKEVYKPLELSEHIKFSKEFG